MNYGIVNQPKSGATLRVWQVADEITRETGQLARRKDVIERIVSEGGNQNTASTQYYYWKTAQQDDGQSSAPAPLDAGPAEQTQVARLSVAEDGTLRLPQDIMSALDIPNGGVLAARVKEGELRLVEPLVALRRVQEMVRPYRTEGRSVVDELVAERRAEARREDEE